MGFFYKVVVVVTMALTCTAFMCSRKSPTATNVFAGSNPAVGKALFEDDPYADMLDLDKPMSSETIESVLSEVSISAFPGGVIKGGSQNTLAHRTRRPPSLIKPQRRWEHWDAWCQQEMGDMDGELEEKDKWIWELRDIVEQKRGYAIWSKRSDKEIQREVKKNVASKSLQMPESVVAVVKAVFLEKTHTYREYKKDNELACIAFRKWMIEQRGKLKKDPLPAAKVEVSNRWIVKAPAMGHFSRQNSLKKGQLPPVVMDECMEPVPGVAFASESGSAKSSSSQNSALVTSSMVNWDKTAEQVAIAEAAQKEKVASADSGAAAGEGGGHKSARAGGAFRVDDVDMFVPSQSREVNSDFFVVI